MDSHKKSHPVFMAMWLIGMLLMSSFFYSHLLDTQHYDAGFWGHRSIGVISIIAGFFAVIFCVVVKQMTTLWLQTVGNENVLNRIYDRLLGPVMSLVYPAGWDFIIVKIRIDDWSITAFLFALGVLIFADPFNFVRRYLISSKQLLPKGNRFFVLADNPTSFREILPFFLIIHVIFVGVYLF